MAPEGGVTKAQERMVGYILDNLTLDNMANKVVDLRKVLRLTDNQNHCEWFSFHFVGRVAFQPSKHEMFNMLLREVKSKQLEERVVRETYRNISILLKLDESRMENMVMLMNLGHWLGIILLARNKPILMVDLDLKLLIIEACKAGVQQTSYVLPFALKVLESVAGSKVFKPPCPWTTSILNLLTLLTLEPRLGTGLRRNVLELCKTLGFQTSQLVLPDNPSAPKSPNPYPIQAEGSLECSNSSFQLSSGLATQVHLLDDPACQLLNLNTGNKYKSHQEEVQIYPNYQSGQIYKEHNSEDQDVHQTYFYESYLENMDQQGYLECPVYQIDISQSLMPYSAVTYHQPMQDFQNYQNYCDASSQDCTSVDFCSWSPP